MKVVVLLSGGLDSTVLLAWSLTHKHETFCLAADYGQRHRRELRSAEAVAAHYRRPFSVVAIPPGVFGPSALTGGGEVPKGLDYRDPGQAATVVPGRNLLFASLGVAHAGKVGAESVWLGAHAGDAAVYPDCRPKFFRGLNEASTAAYGVRVVAPFIAAEKGYIATLSKMLLVPVELTWSCYEGGPEPCGECGACVERAEAFGDQTSTTVQSASGGSA